MTFKRNERLKSEKIITQLFRKGNGQSFACYPLRLVYMEIPLTIRPLSILPISDAADVKINDLTTSSHSETKEKSMPELSPIEFALSVPKKSFKRAVDRNVLRRRIREAYRLHKIELYKYLKNNVLCAEKRFAFMVLYTAKEEMPYAEIERGIKKMIRKFKEETGK